MYAGQHSVLHFVLPRNPEGILVHVRENRNCMKDFLTKDTKTILDDNDNDASVTLLDDVFTIE